MIQALLSQFSGFSGFAWAWILFVWPLPWLVRRVLPPITTQSMALRVPYGDQLETITSQGISRTRPTHVGWLPWLAWTCLCLAAARPQHLGEVVQPPQTSRDLMLAVDLSGSMDERDMKLGRRRVQRLTAAKAVIADFLDRRTGDRIGLIAFGQRAYALTPLTRDLDTVREQLQSSEVGLAGRETAIGDAIGLAVKRLQKHPAQQRVLILLTDGVNTAGALDPIKAAELARSNGVRIHTIAFGGAGEGLSVFGVRINIPNQMPNIDEVMLKKIAESTGGRMFSAEDVDQLTGIYTEIDRLEPIERPGQRLRPRIERYPWPLTLALLCVLVLLWQRRRGLS